MAILDSVTEILLPDSNGSITNWSTTSGGGAKSDVATDDTDYITSTTLGALFNVGFANLSVASAQIISVQLNTIMGTNSTTRGHNVTCRYEYELAGKAIAAAEDFTAENRDIATDRIKEGTVLTQMGDPLTSWAVSDVNSISMNVTYQAQSDAGIDAAVDYICLKVKYKPIVQTYNNTINNPHIASGNISISSGNIFI